MICSSRTRSKKQQVLTSGISAEYGRFSGGVVNTITKSGSNQFAGSFRANLYKPDWTTPTPFEKQNGQERTGALGDNTTYETTIGGPIVKDRLWFFYANRVERVADAQTFNVTGIGFDRTTRNDRNLFKLTGTVAPGHVVEGSYMRNATEQGRPSFGFTIDPAAAITRTLPNDLWVATYRGALTSQLFTEFQVSQKALGFRGNGGTLTDIVDSPFIALTQRLAHYNAPYFDAADPQDRDNRQITANATYYLDTPGFGTHSIKGGFEHFRSTLRGGNSQSATGFVFDADYAVDLEGKPLLDAGGRLVPVFAPGASLIEDWRPIRGATLDIDTLSFYVNDNWVVGNHWTFNLGLRAEQVDSRATGDIVGVDTRTVVPRLAAAYDPTGTGKVTFQTTYGHYAGKYGEAQFSQNMNVGRPDLLLGVYTGPAGQGRDFAPGFDRDNYVTVFGLFPNQNVIFDDQLSSPLTKEFTVSGGTTVGDGGYAKVTFVHRTTGAVDTAGIWRYNSGQAYSIAATGQGLTDIQAAILSSVGYAAGPDPRTLFFSDGRGSGEFKGYGLFDMSFQYSITVWRSLNPWIKAELYNVFNNGTAIRWDTSVIPDPDGPVDELGLPTSYLQGQSFGQTTSPDDYPHWQPGRSGLRTFQVSMGLRF